MKKLILLLLFCTSLSAQWKIVSNRLVPITPSWGIDLRSGFYNTTGLRLGYSTQTDSGTIRYNAGVVQYYNGSTWLTIGTTAGFVASVSATAPYLSSTGGTTPTISLNFPSGSSLDTTRLLFIPSNTLLVSPLFSGKAAPYYSTVQSASTAATSGQVVWIFPATYGATDTLKLITEGVLVKGVQQNAVLIPTVIVTGKDVQLQDITITGNMIDTSQVVGVEDSTDVYTLFRNITFQGNVNLGTIYTTIKSRCRFEDCKFVNGSFYGTGKTLYINSGILQYNYHTFQGCRSLFPINYTHISTTYGGAQWLACDMQFWNVTASTSGEAVSFQKSTIRIKGNLIPLGVFPVVAFDNSLVGFSNAQTWANGEIDFFHCKMDVPAITVNTGFKLSRIISCFGTSNFLSLSGTALNVYTVQNSIFRFASPSGLNVNDANTYSTWTDY